MNYNTQGSGINFKINLTEREQNSNGANDDDLSDNLEKEKEKEKEISPEKILHKGS